MNTLILIRKQELAVLVMVEPLGKDRSSINAHLEPTYKILYDQFMTHEGMYMYHIL